MTPSPSHPWDPHVRALRAFALEGDREAALGIRDDLGNEEVMPVSYYFRSMEGREDDPLLVLERAALAACRGRVLDIGAGGGIHALALQGAGVPVTAFEPDPRLGEVLAARGVAEVRSGSLELLRAAGERFDTLLLLMNGWGLAGTLAGLPHFLGSLEGVLAPGGQVLADSSDLRPLLGGDADGELRRPDGRYLGELHYQLEFRGERADPFPFLFVDPDTLAAVARKAGWRTEILAREGGPGYLSRLTRRGN